MINGLLCIFLFCIAVGKGQRIFPTARKYWKDAVAVGLFSFLAYGMVLFAMKYVDNVSYVVAFRQVSILLTVVAGIFMLDEKRYVPKIVGAVIIFSGLVLVGLFGG